MVRQVLQLYKSSRNLDVALFMNSIEEACDTACPDEEERLIINWDEAAEMLRGGMAIGSHTHSHAILSKLSAEEQLEEMVAFKRRGSI